MNLRPRFAKCSLLLLLTAGCPCWPLWANHERTAFDPLAESRTAHTSVMLPQAEKPGQAASQESLPKQTGPLFSVESDMKNFATAEALKPADIPSLVRTAEAGDGQAQLILALAYNHGYGVKQDYSEAFRWCVPAAEKGFARAQDMLGRLYFLGQGHAKDEAEALTWFRKSAEQGFAEGQYDLGVMYMQGNTLEKDYKQTEKWFLRAAQQWYVPAQVNLCAIYAGGTGVARDLVTAAMWCSLAAGPHGENKLGSRALEQLGQEATPEQISEGKQKALVWANAHLTTTEGEGETHSATGKIASFTAWGEFVLASGDRGKEENTDYSFDMTDAVMASGKDSLTWIPPHGKAITIKKGQRVTVEYRLIADRRVVVSVKTP